MAALVVVWILVLLAARLSAAIPTITFPVNSQVPPVARIGQPFSFVFSQSTFTSPLVITYTLANPPAWLSIESESRRLFGTPQEADVPPGDVVGVPITIIATDDTGSATLGATLVVSREASPGLDIPIDEQIPRFGTFSSPSSILSPPDAPFSFQVLSNTFSSPSDHSLNYYAVTLDNTPLPAWLSFDPSTLSFSGRTPPFESLIQPPQAFGLQLVASDVEGFSAASLEFTIVVGTHEITAAQTLITLNATIGEPILYTALRDGVKVDGQPATSDNAVVKSTADVPPWIKVDANRWEISGTPPQTADSTNFTVTLGDMFSDTLNITFAVEISGELHHSLINKDLPMINVSAGEEFSFDLGPYLINPVDTEVAIASESSPPWIQSKADSTILSGLIPAALTDSAVQATINLKSKTSDTSDSVTLVMRVQNVPASTTTPTTQPSASSTNKVKSEIYNVKPEDAKLNIILLAVVFPILVVIIIGIVWYFRKRKHRQKPKLTTRDISGPLPGSFVVTAHGAPGDESTQDLERQAPSQREQKEDYIESNSLHQTTSVRPLSTARLIPSTEKLRTAANNLLTKGRTASLGSRSAVSSRRGRPTRGNSTLSSISETTSHLLEGSIRMIGSTTAFHLQLPKSGSSTSFRDDIEINIPALRGPGSAYTGEESRWTDAPLASSPPCSSGRPSLSPSNSYDGDILPLRTASRQTNHPPTPSRKFAWAWAKRSNGGSKVSLFSRGGGRQKHHLASLRSSPSVDTFAHEPSPTSSAPRTPTLPDLPRLPSLIRPVTRRGPPADDASSVSSHNPLPTIPQGRPVSTLGGMSIYTTNDTPSLKNPISFIPGLGSVEWQSTGQGQGHEQNSLGILYGDLVAKAPFHPSSSSALWTSAASTPAKRRKDPEDDTSSAILPPNWTVLGEDSPIIKDWNLGASPSTPTVTKSPELPSLSILDRSGPVTGGLRLVSPSSSIRGPPGGSSDVDVMSVYSRTGTHTDKEKPPGSSVISIPKDVTPESKYYSGKRVFSRGEGVSWTADLGRYGGKGKGKWRGGKGKGGAVGSVSRVSIISEMEGDGEGKEMEKEKGKARDDGVSLGSGNGSKSSLGGSHYYL